jgi:hypothetical protein
MNHPDKEIIRYDDPEAATFKTGISGWVDRTGRFFGNGPSAEHMARYSSCTHRICEKCGELYSKNGYCEPCHQKKMDAKFNAMPTQKWDGVTPLYSESWEKFFFDMDEINDMIEDAAADGERMETLEDLRLVICKPNYAREIDDEYFGDAFPEDTNSTLSDLDPELAELVEAVNEYIRKQGKPLSWTPGKFRVDLEVPE